MQVVILAHRRAKDVPLALQRVCGVPLVRRQLQVLRTYDWRQAILIVCPQDRQRIESAIGDLAALGVQLSYLIAPGGTDLPLAACLEATDGDLLIIESHYVIAGALLERLVAEGVTTLLSGSRSDSPSPDEEYAGAAFLTRSDL